MRIVFMGASELGWECCKVMLESKLNIVGILTIPQDFKISWSTNPVRNVRFKSFHDLSSENKIPLIIVDTKMTSPDLFKKIQLLQPDVFVVIGWYYMIPRPIRELAKLGAIGIHASLLPKYRGGAPLVWSIINGESEAGVSLFELTDGVDSGVVFGQRRFAISLNEDIGQIVEKSISESKRLLMEYLPQIITGQAPRFYQDESKATLFPQRKPEDGLINWRTMDCTKVYNWIRAQTRPYPGAFTFLNNEKVSIWKAKPTNLRLKNVDPGSVVFKDGKVHVACVDGRLLEILEFESNMGLKSGDRFGMAT